MSGGLIDKVYIGLDHAPAAFDIKQRIIGANGTNLEYIRSETGVVAVLKGDKYEPLHLILHHPRAEALTAAHSLALNLIETIRAELAQWTAAQVATPPPSMNVPPPLITTSSTSHGMPPPTSTITLSTPTSITTNTQPSTVISPVVSVASAPAPMMTVRQPTVLQLLPQQQQYVLNQENGQLIPIVQPGVQVSNSNFTSLPIAQQLGALQQSNFGTQLVDIGGVQPVNLTPLRLSGVPSSMSMILPNGFTFPHGNVTGGNDTTTVSSALSAPVVCAAQNTNSAQKILYSTDKVDKTDVKYHIQGADTVQWTFPGSQTMLIPYQQLQELTANQTGLANLQPQQFVSIAPAGGMQQSSIPLSAAQFQQLQGATTFMPINQKISTPTKSTVQSGSQDARGQKRMSDGTPNQLQLRPIAPAGSGQDKNSSREMRPGTWSGAVRENTASMGMKINPAHGTIIHVSSGQQTSISTAGGVTHDGQGMFIRQIDRNSIHLQTSKDNQKQDLTQGKIQSAAHNVQMITVPPGMTVLQNHLGLGQMPTVLGQPGSQVYMIPTNQSNIVQAGLNPGILGQQMLQAGQNVTVMQPNQLTGGMQYSTMPLMPMNMNHNAQFMSGVNLNNQLTAQQLNAALANHHLANANLNVSGAIPIVQTNPSGSPLPTVSQTIPVTQGTPIQHVIPQTSTYVTPSQSVVNPNLPPLYTMQPNVAQLPVQSSTSLQYSMQSNQSSNSQTILENSSNNQTTANLESDASNTNTTNQGGYMPSASQQPGYTLTTTSQGIQNHTQQNYSTDTPSNGSGFSSNNPSNNSQPSYTTANTPNVQSVNYNISANPSTPHTSGNYNTPNAPNLPTPNQNYSSTPGPNAQNDAPGSYSTPANGTQSNQSNNYTPPNLVNLPNSSAAQSYPPNQQGNLYPNATGQNMAAYADNQYQYNNRPWFRAPRFPSPQYTGMPPPMNGAPMPVPAPSNNYNYWQDS